MLSVLGCFCGGGPQSPPRKARRGTNCPQTGAAAAGCLDENRIFMPIRVSIVCDSSREGHAVFVVHPQPSQEILFSDSEMVSNVLFMIRNKLIPCCSGTRCGNERKA